MSKNKELIRNTVIIFSGKFCTQFITFFLLPLYTSYLNTSDYGIIDIITTYIALISPIITLQLELGVFRELIDCRQDGRNISKIISSGFVAIIRNYILCLFLFIIINLFLNIEYYFYLALLVLVTIMSNYFLQISRGLGKNIHYAVGSIITGITTIVLSIIFLSVFNMKIDGVLLSTIIANLLCSLYIIFNERLFLYLKPQQFDKKIYKKLLKYSLPLVPNGLVWWIISISDRTIISIILGAGANGIYAVSNKFSNILLQSYSIFNLSWTETASLHLNDEDSSEFFSNIFENVINISYSVCLMLLSLMPFIFIIMVDNSYSDAYNYIPILLIGMFFDILVSFLGAIYIAKKKTKEITKTSLLSAILNIIINLSLIKVIGIYAAAISTLISFLVIFIYRIIDVQSIVKIKYKPRLIPTLIIMLIINIIIYYYKSNLFQIINVLISFFFILFINRSFINTIYSNFTKNFKSFNNNIRMYKKRK